MGNSVASNVVVWAEQMKTGTDETAHFNDVMFLRMDSHVWARGNHYVIAENPDAVTEGDTFLFDTVDPPEIMSVQEFEDGGEMAVMEGGERVNVTTLTGEYLSNAAMGDPGPPPYLEEQPLE